MALMCENWPIEYKKRATQRRTVASGRGMPSRNDLNKTSDLFGFEKGAS